MNADQSQTAQSAEVLLSTQALANVLSCAPATIRKRHSTTGTFFGVQPKKMPNRRLLWPSDSVGQLLDIASRGQAGKLSHSPD